MAQFLNPIPQHFSADGPLAFYKVYFGEPNQDPKDPLYTKAPYSDQALTVPIATTQTLDTDGKYQSNVYLDGAYSIRIESPLGTLWRELAEVYGLEDFTSFALVFSSYANMLLSESLVIGQFVETGSYIDGAGKGGGSYEVIANAFTADNFIYGDTAGGLQVKLISAVKNQYMAGTVADGATNDYVALQAVADTGLNIDWQPGDHAIETEIQLQPGSYQDGKAAGRFSTDTDKNLVTITNSQVGGGCFWYTGDTSTGQITAPKIKGFKLVADYPVRFNDRTGVITDGGAQPYLMKPLVTDCIIQARVSGTGYGLDVTKCFDGTVTRNEIINFDINVLLVGSDLNTVEDNRIVNGDSYNILEFATGTFGSQNNIRHNDILLSGSAATFIKSNSRHVRIYDNYLEKPSGTCTGFVDLSETGMPAIFGSNTAATSLSVVCKDNRVDGMSFATDFVYRLNPVGVSHTIYDTGTTGTAPASGKGLLIEGDLLPVSYNSSHPFVYYDFRGEQFGKWDGFKNGAALATGKDLTVDVLSYSSLDADAPNTNTASDFTRFDGDGIVLLTGHSAVTQQWYPPASGSDENVNFKSGESYTVTFQAKTDSGSGDTFQAGRIVNGAGDGLSNYTLVEQYTEFSFAMSGSAITNEVGVYFTRSTTNGNIKIRSLTWTIV